MRIFTKGNYRGYNSRFVIQARDIQEFEEKMARMQKIADEKEYVEA